MSDTTDDDYMEGDGDDEVNAALDDRHAGDLPYNPILDADGNPIGEDGEW